MSARRGTYTSYDANDINNNNEGRQPPPEHTSLEEEEEEDMHAHHYGAWHQARNKQMRELADLSLSISTLKAAILRCQQAREAYEARSTMQQEAINTNRTLQRLLTMLHVKEAERAALSQRLFDNNNNNHYYMHPNDDS
jgi:molecular chaperone GrpE (heat shock protein)